MHDPTTGFGGKLTTMAREGSKLTTLTLALLMILMPLTAVAPLVGTAGAATDAGTGEVIRAIATYASFEDVPTDAQLADRGLDLLYRFQAIPAVGISGAETDVYALEDDPALERLEEDRKLTYFSNTAVFSTDVAEVWQDPQWPTVSDFDRPPIEVDTDGDGTPERIDGSGTTIAVVDTGVNGLHPDLWAESTHVEGVTPFEPKLKECVNVPLLLQESTPYCDQTVGHGTHVAGIAAGNGWAVKNGLAIQSSSEPYIGTAPSAKLVAAGAGAGIFVLDATSSLDYMYANRDRLGITVVTNSYGDVPGCSSSFPGGTLISLQNQFIEAGIPVLFAAGNYDTSGKTWTSTYARNPTPGVISVANYDDFDTATKNGAINSGSSDGCVSTEAGGDYVWTWPDVSAPGSSIASTASYTGALVPPVWDPPFYASAGGTSMSTPHVAGVTALMLQANPDLTPAEVEEILIDTADKWSDGVSSRLISGTDDMWGIPSGLNDQALATFLANDWDPSTCRITPTMAQQAADGIPVDGLPRFEDLENPEAYVCRDYRRGAGLVDAYAAVQEAVARTGTTSPEVSITSPGDGQTVSPTSITVEGDVDRLAGDGTSNPPPEATLTPTPESGDPPLDVTFSISASDDGSFTEWSLDFGDGSTPAGDAGGPPASVDHTYTEEGTYDAILSVTDDDGATSTAQARVQVGGPEEVRIGTDPAGDTATGSCSNGATACETSWVDAADDGLDLTAAYVKDIGDSLRFTFQVNDADAFYNEPSGDPASGDPAHIVGYQLTAQFQTSPATVYTLNLERDRGGDQLTTTLGKRLGVLILNSNLGQGHVDKAEDVFWADVPKSEMPELAVLGSINEIDISSQITQEGASVQLLTTMDTLDNIENSSYETDPAATQAAAYAFAGEPLDPPSQVPADPEVEDPNGDVTAAGAPIDHMDIEAAWFENDDNFLYAGLKVADIPADPTTTTEVAYHVNFAPSWAQDASAWGSSGTFTGLRAEAILSPVNARDGTPTDGQHDFELQVLSTTATGSTFSRVAGLPLSTVDADNDIIWFVIPMDELREPPTGATLTDLGADAVPAQQGLVTFGTDLGDGATSSASYEVKGRSEPLSVSAGGPYDGAPGETVTIAAQPSGGQAPISCSWTAPADVTLGDASACTTTASATQLSTYTLSVTATDDSGAQATDSTTFTVSDAAGERVQIRLDGGLLDAVPVSTSTQAPTDTWSTSIDLSGLSGQHALTAEWLDSDESVLDTATVSVTVSTGTSPTVTITSPADDATVDGVLAIEGQAGHGGTSGSGGSSTTSQQSTPAFGPGGLYETQSTVTREDTIAAPCAPCQDLGPGGSVAWGMPVDSEADGSDGRWLDVSGLAGSIYELDAHYDAPMDVYFYPTWEETTPLGSNVGPNDEKTGTIPSGATLAFVYMRRPTTDQPDTYLERVYLNATEPLSAPTDLTAEAGADAITLTWGPPASTGLSDVQAYNIYKDDMTTPVTQVDAATTTWTDTGLAEGEQHTYWVSAVNERLEGPKAGPRTAQTSQDLDTTPPSKVTGLTATDVTSTSVSLAWDPATDDTTVDGYNVYLDGAFQFSVTDTSAVVGGLDPETAYTIEVAAEDGARNEGPRSDPITATTEAATGETVTLTLDGSAIATIGVDTSTQDPDDWATHLDTRTILDGPHTLEATYDDGAGGVASTSIDIQVDNPDPAVEITGPSTDQDLAPPTEFQGTWTTDGDSSEQGQGASPSQTAAPGLKAWIQDPYVRTVLRSDAYQALTEDLVDLPGYLGSVPVTQDGGKLLVLLRGDVPTDLPATELLDRPVEYRGHTTPDTLMRPVAKAQNVVTPEEAGLQRTASHQGPSTPGIQQGIGPGSAIQMDFGGSTFICTASYLFQDPSTGTYYLATAGHCLLESGAESSVTDPGAVADRVRLCYQNCVMNYVGLGTYVELSPDPQSGYHPVAFAQQYAGSPSNDVGNDFGLIEIPPEINDLLRPHLSMWGGPTDFERPSTGQPLAHYGHGTGPGLAVPTQGRLATTISASKSAGIFAAGAINGGDSGSAIGTAFPRTESLLIGDGASGAITHGVVGTGAPIMWGTDLERGLDMAEPAIGFRPDLVTEDAEILPSTGEDPLGVSITTPPDGATIDPTETPQITIAGDGTFPPASGPGEGQITYWLHREDCGGSNDNPHMDRTKSPDPEGGDGCGSLAHPIGPAWETALGEIATVHPSQPVPSEDIYLDPLDPIEASVWVSGYSGASENPQPVPSVILDMEARLTYTQGAQTVTVGSHRITDEMGAGTPTEIDFSFLPEAPMVPAGADLTFTIVVHHAVGPVFIHYGGEHASNVVLPEGTAPDRSVEISLDDPGFTDPITATGTTSWQTTVDASTLATGEHTIYARAVQEGEVQDPPASVGITLETPAPAGPTADLVFDTHGLTADIQDASQAGDAAITDRTWQLGDGTTFQDVTALSHTYSEPGSYTVILTVEDADGRTDQVTAEVTVGGVDDHVVQVRLAGPDGEAFGWDTVADGDLGDDGDWARTWAPGANPTEGTYSLTARMLNGGGVVASDEATYTVVDPNFAPEMAPVEDHAVLSGTTLTFTVEASDPDGDALTYSAPVLPDGATFDAETQTFTWTPTEADLGDHTVRFEVTDGQATDAEEATVSVIETAAVNLDTGAHHAFIQDAIDAAGPDETIAIAGGTHAAAPTVAVEGLTLCTANADLTGCADTTRAVIDASGISTTALSIQAPDVTVDGLELIWDGTASQNVQGIEVQGDRFTLTDSLVDMRGTMTEDSAQSGQIFGIRTGNAADVTVQDSTLQADLFDQDAMRMDIANGLYAGGPGLVVDGTTVTGWASNGIFLGGNAAGATIQGSTVTQSGTGVLSCNAADVTVTGTTFEQLITGVQVCASAPDGADADTAGLVLRENLFAPTIETALALDERVQGDTVDARLNDWSADRFTLVEARVQDDGQANSVQLVPFLVDGTPEPGLVRIQEQPDAAFLGVQEAIDAALPGQTVLVPASQTTAEPTPRPEAITVATDGVTVCGSVAGGPACASELTEGHFELSAAEWAPAPGDGAGQAILFDLDANAGRSTSYYPATGTQVADIESVAFDYFIESGTCGAGSPRIALWMDINGDGSRTGQANTNETALVYSDAFQAGDCATDAWARQDMLADDDDARYVWNGTTYQTRQAFVDAVTTEIPGHQVDSVNIQWDTGSGQIYIDDHTVDGALLGEPSDVDCYFTAGTTCRWEGAGDRTILHAPDTATTVANLTSTGTSLEGMTLRWTGTPTQAIAGARIGADEARVANTTIEVQGGGCSAEDITAGTCYEPAETFGILARQAPAGVEIVDNEIRGDIEDDRGEIGGTTGVRGILPAGTMEGNFLTGWASHGALVRGDGLTVEANSFFTNMVGLKVCDDYTTQVLKNEFVGSAEGIAITECGSGEEPVFHDNQLGLTNAVALHVQSSVVAESFDATCNDWGVYNGLAIEDRVQNDGTEVEVDQTPFTGGTAGGLECLNAPSAAFTFEPQTQITRLDTVNFTSQATQGSKPILLHQWDFGDDGLSLMEDPSHSYDSIGTYEVRYRVTDLDGMISTAIREIEVVNLPPALEDVGDIDVPHSTEITFDADATDAEGDPLTYSLAGEVPEDATFDNQTGAFNWTPGPTDDGIYDIDVIVDDTYDTVTDHVQLTVRNEAPAFQDLPSNVAGNEELEISFPVVATDAEGDAVTMTADLPHENMTFEADGGVGSFSWTPAVGENGTYHVTFTAESIGEKVTTQLVEIAVGAFNTPPTLSVDVPSHARPDSLLTVDASVTDPDSHQINWTVEAGPDVFADSFSPETGFSTTWEWWVPQGRTDTIEVTFTADDGVNTVHRTVAIEPLKTPNAGFLTPTELSSGLRTTEVIAGEPVELRAQAGDEDGTIVTAHSAGFTSETATVGPTERPNAVLWTAEATFPAGEHVVEFSVTDDDQLTTTVAQTIVARANTAPDIAPIDDISGDATGPSGLTVEVQANASDPDGRGIASYTWTIDPGTAEETSVPGAQLIHAFSVGTHTVELEVTDANGGSATETFTVAVDDALFASEELVGAEKNADGVYIVDTTRTVGDNLVLNVSATDDLGADVQGAIVSGEVYYTALDSNEDNRAQVDSISAVTGADGNVSIELDKDLFGRATAPGHHTVELTVSKSSRSGAPDAGAETLDLTVRYYIGPDGPQTQL